MPTQSAACHTCKIRRIKCDENKPTCQKCAKSRRICLDAAAVKEISFVIHVENSYVNGSGKRPRGPRSSLAASRLSFDLQSRALGYYLNCHLKDLPNTPTAVACLPQAVSVWNASGRKSSMVDLALSSLALAVFARTHQHQPAAKEASSRYYRLLQVVQDRIAEFSSSTCDAYNVDTCILVALLMGRYECAVYHPTDLEPGQSSDQSFKNLQHWSHNDGIMAILKTWNDSSTRCAPTFMIKLARKALIGSCILRNLAVPSWVLDGARFGEGSLELEYDQLMIRLVNVHHTLFCMGSLPNDRAYELSVELQELDIALQEWAAKQPASWSHQLHTLSEPGSLPRSYFYSPTIYTYSKASYGAFWIQFFAFRMFVNSTRLRALDLVPPNLLTNASCREEYLECTNNLKAMANGIASSIPYVLGKCKVDDSSGVTLCEDNEVKPYLASFVIRSLSIASGIDRIDALQRLWFRSELGRLGKIIGHGVFENAANDQWPTI